MKSNKAVPVLFTLLALSSCAKVKDMHDATMEMNATTAKLADTSSNMGNVMNEVMDTGRQGASLDLRNKLWDAVIKSPSLEDKANSAALYFEALEIALWNNQGLDKLQDQRDLLMKDAAEEFFCHLLAINHWDEVEPFAGKGLFAPGATQNEQMAFNAASMVLEKANRKSLYISKVTGQPPVTMLSMIETALVAGKSIREGKSRPSDYPAYVEMIRSHEKDALKLLEARYQMLGLFALTELTKIGQNKVEGFKYKIWGSSWELDFSKLNDAEIKKTKFRFTEAQRAKNLLAELGVNVELNPSIKKVFSHAKVVNLPAITTQGADGVTSEASGTPEQREFLGAMNEYAGS